MGSFYTITKPEATRNLVLNPSAERSDVADISTYVKAHVSDTVTLALDAARFGARSYKIVAGAVSADHGLLLVTETMANAAHTISFYLRGTLEGTLVVIVAAPTTHAAVDIGGGAVWRRYAVTVPAGECSGRAFFQILDTGGAGGNTFYLDGIQCEEKSYETTYIDGDQPGGTWAGEWHASASTRPASYRPGGREYNLESYVYRVTNVTEGIGAPPVRLNAEMFALLPGALYQSQRSEPRVIDLVLGLKGDDMAGLHAVRKDIVELLGPGDGQAVRLGYSGANAQRVVTIAGHYQQGLSFDNVRGFVERPVVRLWCADPYWYEDDQQTAMLMTTATIASAAFALGRIDGLWQTLGSGFDNDVQCYAVDRQRGRLYAGGAFTTANGVTVNRVTYWDGTTFHALGTTPGVNATVYALAVAPNGDVWVGGAFTTAGGAASYGLARWNIATNTWTVFTNGTSGDTVYAIAIAPENTVYFAGNFINWDGLADADYLAGYDGSAFFDLGAGRPAYTATYFPRFPHALLCGPDGTLYAGGANLDTGSITTALYRYTGSWQTAKTTNAVGILGGVHALVLDAAGNLYIGGSFASIDTVAAANIARFNGTLMQPLGNGAGNACFDLALGDDDVLIVGAPAIDLPLTNIVSAWNGSNWFALDVDPQSSNLNALATLGENIYLGLDAAGTATRAGITTITNGATAPTYPIITLVGPGTLEWIENQTTGKRLYFDLGINSGEEITIDLRPGQRKVKSQWRGTITDQPLSFSQLGSFHLTPGENVLAAFVIGGDANTKVALNWVVGHVSVDGVAS